MESGLASRYYFLQELGIPLSGVSDQGDLTSFQFQVLALVRKEQNDALSPEDSTGGHGLPSNQPHLNSRALPHGGGRQVEHVKYVNMSEKTGESPDTLISKHTNNDEN